MCRRVDGRSMHVQARTALAYEGVVDAARHEVAARMRSATEAERAAAARESQLAAETQELRVEVDRKEAHLKALSQVWDLRTRLREAGACRLTAAHACSASCARSAARHSRSRRRS
jgi:hypothetical protein